MYGFRMSFHGDESEKFSPKQTKSKLGCRLFFGGLNPIIVKLESSLFQYLEIKV
jgi:hypothetical protein